MASTSKRHYRVAKRDQDLEETLCVSDEQFEKVALLGLIMYIGTVTLSFVLGYMVGKDQ